MSNESNSTIVIDGVSYPIEQFSDKVQTLAEIITIWEQELKKSRLETAKIEAALREANREITSAVTEELGK